MSASFWREEPLAIESYRDLVELLHANVATLVLASLLQTALCAAVAARLADVILIELALIVAATAVARLAVVFSCRLDLPDCANRPALLMWEGRHAVASIAAAAAFGAIGARVALRGDGTAIFMFATVVANFAMELVARASGRPWICRYALVLSFVPAICALICRADAAHLFDVAILIAILAASLEIVRFNYRTLTGRIDATRSFAHLAKVDPLTGLPNRLALQGFLDRSLAYRGADEIIAVHCLDLDRFKEANDLFGHAVGDELLKAFAMRLRKSLTPDDFAARLGGDEFVIVQCSLRRDAQARQLAQHIVERVAEIFEVDGRKISLGVSIGIALAPSAGEAAQSLLAEADAALYRIKRCGRNGFAFAGREPPKQEQETALSAAA